MADEIMKELWAVKEKLSEEAERDMSAGTAARQR